MARLPEIRDVAAEVAELEEQGVRPGLGVVLVGEDPASQVYVRMKEKAWPRPSVTGALSRLASITASF